MNVQRTGAAPAAALALALAAFFPAAAPAQQPDGQWKGIFEPANIPADVYVNDIYFVTPEVGWASGGAAGEGGTLWHTRDGGATWTRTLGDPASQEPAFQRLHFIDPNHGWAVQNVSVEQYSLLRTRDGQNWEQHGAIDRGWGLMAYQFLSPSVGLYLDGNNNISRIMKTTDGGKTWREVFHGRGCVTVPVQGLTRTLDCPLEAMHFNGPRVGYAIGQSGSLLFVAKTEDSGESWSVWAVPDLVTTPGLDFDVPSVWFLDESTGLVGLSDGKFYRTADGGRTWSGTIGTRGGGVRFADPGVGWAISGHRSLSITTDRGRTWTGRELAFPGKAGAMSLPRRDRGYVAGEHGMVYRYRIVPASEQVANALPGPAMPGFDSPLDEGAEALEGRLADLRGAVERAAGGAGASVEGAADDAATEAAVAFDPSCCLEPLGELDAAVELVAGEVPDFVTEKKNLNLLLSAVRWAALLPARVSDMKSAAQEFRQAADLMSAEAALDRIEGAVHDFGRATRQAFGSELPAPDEWATVDEALYAPLDSAVEALPGAEPVGEGAAEEEAVEGSVVEEAAKGVLGKLKKKKIKIP